MHVKSAGVSSSLTVTMAYTGAQRALKSDKVDEAQALAKSCAGRPDFLPCDGLSICATHSHGKCFKLHWCCHLGWCHCKWPTSAVLNNAFDSTLFYFKCIT